MKIQIDGKEFAVDDFEGRELVDAERTFGISLPYELDRGSMSGVYALVYLVKKRENKAFTIDDAFALKLGDVKRMVDNEQEEESDPPPNRAQRRAKTSA